MDVEFSVLGGFPRSRRFRHAIRDYEEGRLDETKYTLVFLQELGRVVGIQNAYRYTIVTDGQFDWHDLFRPFSSSWRGVYPSSLLRYFDNNFFYRIPVFHAKPEPYSFFVARRARLLGDMLGKEELGKIVIPGPITFAGLSKNLTGKDYLWLAEKIAEALNIELRGVADPGRFILQIDEPGLSEPEIYEIFKGSVSTVYSSLTENLGFDSVMISIYFRAPVEDAYLELLELDNIDIVSLDWADDKRGVELLLKEYGVKGDALGLGVIDGRNIYSEKPDAVAKEVVKLLDGLDVKRLFLTTSTWLELIPLKYAALKTGLLAQTAASISRFIG